MKQRRHLKKLMAVPLALVLLVGMALPILAETDDPPSDAGFALASEGTDGAPSPDGSPEDGSNTEGSGTPDDPQSEELPQSSSVGEDDSTPESDSSLEAEDDSELEDDSDASLADADLMLMSLGALVEGVDYETVYLDAEKTQVDEASIIVLTDAALVEALTNTTPFRNIHLGADILSKADLTVNASKAGARLVGQRPEGGATYTYTQQSSLAIIRLSSLTGGASFTFESINILGLNYYGVAYGGGVANHIVFKNVSYEGPQMLHATGSTVTLQDCSIHLLKRGNDSNEAQELFEIGNSCEVLGTVTINSESVVQEVFDLSSTPTFTVRTGAALNVAAKTPLFIGGLNMVLEAGGNITATTTSYPFNSAMTGFTMGGGAVFDIACGSGTYNLLPVSGTLNVNGASLLRLNQTGGTGAYSYGIYYTGSAAATLHADTIDVKSYNSALYSTNSASAMNITASSCTFSSTAQYGIWFAASSLNINTGTLLVNSNSTGYAGLYSTKPVTITAANSMTVTTGGAHAISTTAALTLQSCGTVALKPKSNGAGIYNTAGGVTIADCDTVDITTLGSGAGIYAAGLTASNCGSFTITATGSGMGINPVGNATFSNVGLAVNTGAGVGFSAATTGAQLGFTGGSVTFGTGGDCFSISASGSTLAFDSLPVRLVGGSCINHSAVGSAVVRFTGCPSVSLAATGGDGVKMSGNGAASLIFDRPGRLEISASGICVNATGYTKTISFLSPGRAILSAGGAGVVGVYGTGTYATKVNITTGALNRWNSPTLVANPTNIWNLASGGSMVLTGSGTGNAGALTIDTAQSTLPVMGTDPIAEALTTSTLNLTGTKLMVLGELGLTVDTVYDQSPAITGKTAAGAAVSAAFTDGVSAGVSGSAGGDGAYAMDILAFEPDVGTAVTVTARYDELSVRRQTVVRDASAFTLSIEVPQTITYGTVAVSTREQWVSLADELLITVADNRLRRGEWALQVQVAGSFTAMVDTTTYELDGRMALVQENTEPVYLTETLQTIYTRSDAFDDEVIIDLSEALQLYLPPGDGVGYTVFTVDIHWVLVET